MQRERERERMHGSVQESFKESRQRVANACVVVVVGNNAKKIKGKEENEITSK